MRLLLFSLNLSCFLLISFVVVNNNGTFIAALGGSDGASYLSSVEIFSSLTQAWTYLPNMTIGRGVYPAACAVNKTKLIACGGYNGSVTLGSCEMLDLTSQGLVTGWKLIANMSTFRYWTSGVLLPDNKTFLVTGGYDGGNVLSSCEKLDIATNTWSSVGNLSLGRRGYHTSVLFNNTVVVIGGYPGGSVRHKTCEQFDF